MKLLVTREDMLHQRKLETLNYEITSYKSTKEHIRKNAESCIQILDFMIDKINKGENYFYIYYDDLKGAFLYKNLKEVIQMIQSLGFKIHFYEYSDSWQYKSGKYGYCYIDYSKEV